MTETPQDETSPEQPEPEKAEEAAEEKPKREYTYLETLNKFADEFADSKHEGYYWMILPQHHGMFNFMNTGETRGLVCEKCGLFVADTFKHAEWHEKQS